MTLQTIEKRRQPSQVARRERALTVLKWLTWSVTTMLAAASLPGLLVEGIYAGSDATAEMLRGYDLVTVLVVVPGLAVTAGLVRHRAEVAHLVLTSLLAAAVYTDAYYLFGTGFNDLFLLHAAMFTTGLVALGVALATLPVEALRTRLEVRAKPRAVAVVLAGLAVALGGMWIYLAADNAVTGNVPEGSKLVETATVVHLGMALDLTLLVPLYAAAAILLWRRAPWGYGLAGVALISGIVHQLGYIVAMPFQVIADIPDAVAADPGEPVIVALYLAGAILLLRGAGRRRHSGASLSGERETDDV